MCIRDSSPLWAAFLLSSPNDCTYWLIVQSIVAPSYCFVRNTCTGSCATLGSVMNHSILHCSAASQSAERPSITTGVLVSMNLSSKSAELSPLTCSTVTSHRLCSCLLYTSPSPRDRTRSRMPSSA
eukprot:TRINITY_DN18164_c0_g1_i1.p1 TRINITY_DN18164_c0_g1~~TRINITY_DN18164_c0_g1_i1.p1  ORF type:complete len:126 (-),score=15.18 TRINITY_DN18164_c0_g1_i1:54-431(-)